MARLLLGVSGGIAAYKALELVRLATAAGHAVRVVQTPTSTRFVGTASFAALTGAVFYLASPFHVFVDLFVREEFWVIEKVMLSQGEGEQSTKVGARWP